MIDNFFTVPEINFICIYAEKCKSKTIENIMDAIPYFTEKELIVLAEDVINKLDKVTNGDFSILDFPEQFSDEE